MDSREPLDQVVSRVLSASLASQDLQVNKVKLDKQAQQARLASRDLRDLKDHKDSKVRMDHRDPRDQPEQQDLMDQWDRMDRWEQLVSPVQRDLRVSSDHRDHLEIRDQRDLPVKQDQPVLPVPLVLLDQPDSLGQVATLGLPDKTDLLVPLANQDKKEIKAFRVQLAALVHSDQLALLDQVDFRVHPDQ